MIEGIGSVKMTRDAHGNLVRSITTASVTTSVSKSLGISQTTTTTTMHFKRGAGSIPMKSMALDVDSHANETFGTLERPTEVMEKSETARGVDYRGSRQRLAKPRGFVEVKAHKSEVKNLYPNRVITTTLEDPRRHYVQVRVRIYRGVFVSKLASS